MVKGRQAQVEQCRQVGPWLPLGVGQPPPGSRSPGHPEDAPGVVQLPPSSEPCTPTRQEGIPPPAWISPGVGAAPLPRRQTTKEARDQDGPAQMDSEIFAVAIAPAVHQGSCNVIGLCTSSELIGRPHFRRP